MMEDHVVTVEIEAETLDDTLRVQDATITLGVNAIPTIELTCAPTTTYNAPLVPEVERPTISEFSELYQRLAVNAEGRDTEGNVSITVKDRVAGGDEKVDSISLDGWILSGAGMSTIGATRAPVLSVVMQHPICKLTKVGSIYETPRCDMATKVNEAIASSRNGNFLEIVEAMYGCVKKLSFWPSPKKAEGWPEKLRERLGTGEFSPSEYLKYNGNGIFLGQGNDGEAMKVRLAQAIATSALPNSGGSSTWDMIVGASGPLMLSVVQDKECNFTEDKLIIEPTDPWKKSSITLDENRCTGTEVPGMDPLRIMGVMARKLGPYSDILNEGLMRNGELNKQVPVEEMIYVPPVDIEKFDGRIIKTNPPAILEAAFRKDAPSGKNIISGLVMAKKAREEMWNGMMYKYCKALYETTAASMIRARANMVLGFHDTGDTGGNLILPGNTCVFKAEGKSLYYGYATRVVHYLSVSGGCSTVVDMSYVRPNENFEINGETAITAGSGNAAYAS